MSLSSQKEARPKTYVYTEGRFSEEFYDINGYSSCTKDELIAMILMMRKYWKVIE